MAAANSKSPTSGKQTDLHLVYQLGQQSAEHHDNLAWVATGMVWLVTGLIFVAWIVLAVLVLAR